MSRQPQKISEYFGVEIEQLKIDRITLDQIVIPVLELSHKDDAVQSKIQAHDLMLKIDLAGQGLSKISKASSRYISIDIDVVQQTDASSNDQSVKDLMAAMPLMGLKVERVEIDYRQQGKKILGFDGELLRAEDIWLQGFVSGAHVHDAELKYSMRESKFDFQLIEIESDAKIIDWSGAYRIEEDWLLLDFEGDVSFAKINKYLIAHGVQEYIREDVSSVNVELEVDLARSSHQMLESMVTRVDLDASLKVSPKAFGLKQAQVDIRTSCLIKALDATHCQFNHPQHAFIEFHKTPGWFQDYFKQSESRYVIEINPDDQIDIELSSREILDMRVKGNAYIGARAQSSQFMAEAWMTDFQLNGIEQDWELLANYKVKLNAEKISAPMEISRMLFNAEGKLDANASYADIFVDKGLSLIASDTNYEEYAAKRLELKQLNDANLKYQFDESVVSAKNLQLVLLANELRNAEVVVESESINLNVQNFKYSDTKQNVTAELIVNELQVKQQAVVIEGSNLNAAIKLNNNDFLMTGAADVGKQKHPVNFSMRHNLKVGVGSAAMNANAIALSNNEIITNNISETGFPLQLKSGSLDVNVDATWDGANEKPNVLANFSASQVNGDYAQNQFSNLNVDLEFSGQQGWSLVRPTTATIESMNVGVPLNDISMRLESVEYGVQQQPLLKVSDLSASVLDGSIFTQQVEIDLNRPQNEFSVYLSALSLEKLIALNQTKDLVASGSLDGELPMRLDNGVLVIEDGWLRADEEGGFIKYGRIGEVLTGNENLELVGELLKDFRYNEMSAQVNLKTGGALTLATKLHGRSPKAQLNKQVNLNFNIEFNLWKFLESARLLTRIGEDVSEQIKSK